MSGVSFARSDTSLGAESSEATYRERLKSREVGDVFTIPSVQSGESKLDTDRAIDFQLDKNPFKIPSDIDIFLLRDKQKEKAKAVVERETIHDYINQKRQMFLLQYAVTVKKDEIQKLENLAIEEEAKLEKAEEDLERDAAMFDEFLKENDRNSAQALKIAEKETKAKLEKIIEIRELTAQMMNIQSEIARIEDTLQEYVVFKDFLFQLSPKEWREDYERRRMKEKEKVVKIVPDKDVILSKSRDWQQKRKSRSLPKHSSFDLSALDVSSSKSPSQIFARRESLRISQVTSRQNLRSQLGKKSSIAGDRDTPETPSDDDDDDEEPELYFTDPHQLLNLFTELEEQNLSLIQNSQETEETIDELRHTLAATRNKMDREIEQLQLLTVTLQANIVKEEETAADLELKSRVFSFGEYKADVQDKMLVSLHRKVLEVYRRCIGENEANLGTLQMLTVIEHQLDDLLECLERIPPAKIEQAEKAKEKERRMRMREEKIRQQRLLQEERLQRALARAQADVKRKSGRRLIFRSEPPAYKEKEDEDQGLIDKEKEELLYYFT